jgi:quercetin dioxygenase-like cupin family protein
MRTDSNGQEVIVWNTEYMRQEQLTPRHYHPAAITFHVLAGWVAIGTTDIPQRAQ